MTEPVLTARQLNRASLARQLLLERATMRPTAAIERLAGLQAQHPASPYLALWARLAGFDAASLDHAIHTRQVVKATLMRGTLHAVSARDFAAYWPALAPTIASFRDRTMRWPADAMPLDELTESVLDHAAEPRTNIELRDLSARLAGAQGERDAWRGVRLTAPFVAVPGTMPWSFGPRPVLAAARSWISVPLMSETDGLDHLVHRYLTAFGPATVPDICQWTHVDRGRTRAALERLGPKIRRFRDEAGRLLFDIVGGPLPPAETPAPPRFLPMWDSLLLAYEDRGRMIPERYRRRVVQVNGDYLPTFLVDGSVAGLWHAEAVDKRTTIRWYPFEPLAPAVEAQLAREATRLAAFVEPLEPAVYRTYHARWVK